MNLDNNDIEIEEVLYRYFRKELSDIDKAEVDAWKSNSLENEKTFNEQRLLFLDMKGISYYRNLDLNAEKSWDHFKVTNNVKPTKSYTYLRYAASVAIVLSAIIGIYLYQSQPGELSISDNGEVQSVQLSDGSDITLNEGATLKYVEPFQNNERRVQLVGEGYFDVTKNPEKPFIVDVQDVEVRVLGTKFFINEPGEGEINVLVEEGKVLVSYNDLHQIVEAGQSISVDLDKNILKTPIKDDIGLTTFWKTRRLVFDQTPIEDVASIINETYNSTIELEGSLEDCFLTVTFEDESLENVLEIVSSTLNYEVEKNQGSIILKGNGCK